MNRSARLYPTLLVCVLLLPGLSAAQEPLPHHFAELYIDSGDVRNSGSERAVTFSHTLELEGASWLRLFFSDIELGRASGGDEATVLRITSLADGAVQTLDGLDLERWQRSSAFFNGDAVRIELVAEPGAEPSRLRITEVMVGDPEPPGEKSICGATDDRTLSNDARDARAVPVGCTVWLIDDAEGCFLSAGHCVGSGFSVIEFDVPLSSASGSTNHPPPDKQYPVDPSSIQSTSGGVGNDWAYFGTFPNSQTELTAAEAQGASYTLGTPPSPPAGETIRITGYGSTVGTGAPLEWSQVQKTHIGPLSAVFSTTVQYATDTTGGNSGSAVFNDDDGTAIGIHTHGGCGAGGGANQGTSILHPNLQNALANPQGVCLDGPPPLRVSLSVPVPDPVPPAGTNVQVEISDRAGAPAVVAGADLVYDIGGGDVTVPLVAAEGALWEAQLPAIACGEEVLFRIDVESTGGTTVRHPFSSDNSVDRRYRRWVADAYDASFRDTFETDSGWTVTDSAGLSAGSWERGVPGGYGLREDPPWDADSSGSCFLTDPSGGNTDVDGGSTTLTSPPMDATQGADPHITYWRWWSDGASSDDSFLIEITDDGATWVTLETVGPNVSGSWVRQSFRVADFVTPSAQVQIRFTASDLGGGDVVEAAVDGVALTNTASGLDCGGGAFFTDGFESGDTSAWSSTAGGGA